MNYYLMQIAELMEMPISIKLLQNYPNPFNPSTMIKYNMPVKGFVTVRIYNTMGQEVENLEQGEITAGVHEIQWTTKNLSSGVYFYKMQAGQYLETKKMIYRK
jgi:hypothetical protein